MRPLRTNECGHPDRPHVARGKCKSCYDRARHGGELHSAPLTPRPDKTLVARAEALRAELEAAAGYGERVTWRAIAERLGVKPATLERARVRARTYARRDAPELALALVPDLLDEDPYLFLDEGESVA